MRQIINKTIIVFFILLLHLTGNKSFSQVNYNVRKLDKLKSNKDNEQALRPVKLGEIIPDIFFETVLNYSQESFHLSDFRGKLLILDFWNTHCGACISLFPKLEKLQSKFGSKLMILPVGFDLNSSDGKISDYLQNSKGTYRELKLPTAVRPVGDSILTTLFPGQGMPREVWISPEGRLLGVTDSRAVEEKNITRIISGENLPLGIKKSVLIGADTDSFLIKPTANGMPKNYGAVFTNYLDSLLRNFRVYRDSLDNFNLVAENLTVYNYYAMAFEKELSGAKIDAEALSVDKRILMEPNHPESYSSSIFTHGYDNWEIEHYNKKNRYCFQLVLPKSFSNSQGFQYFKRTVVDFFKIDGRIENRNVKCLSLIRTSNLDKIKSKSNKKEHIDRDHINGNRIYQGWQIEKIVNTMDVVSFLDTYLPVINQTGYQGSIDISLPGKQFLKLSELQESLHKYDLDLIETIQTMPMLILRDTSKAKK